MKSIKKILMILVVTVLVLNTVSVQASSDRHYKSGKSNNGNRTYKDVKEDNWAKKYIDLMTKYKIIDGYGDDTFRPNATVSRQEFAKMMVNTLGMDLQNPKTATFVDVKKGDWGYKFIETAKNYLTGYSNINGLYFKPTLDAQREDMAVAVVKGLDLDVEDTDMRILDTLKDKNSISKNLRPYVAAAMNEGIMIGDTDKYFKPTASLTRAEAATLLARLILEEKVVFDESKVVIDDDDDDDDTKEAPTLTFKYDDEKVVLKWTKADEDEFESYRVVLSEKDSKPAYPSDGYAEKITNINVLGYEIEAGDSYRDGDFGDEIEEGETYYASITVVYKDENVTSNVVKITIPDDDDDEDRTPTLTSTTENGKIKLTWTETSEDDFEYYKVVLSKYNTKPSYPNDGYLTEISDEEVVNFVLSPGLTYTGGDVGILEAGQKYYATVTAVYEDGDIHYTSNVITITLP